MRSPGFLNLFDNSLKQNKNWSLFVLLHHMHMHPSSPEFELQGAEFFLLCPFKPATDTSPANGRHDGVTWASSAVQNRIKLEI